MTSIHPQPISGLWYKGYALDLHTTGSTYLGVDEFGRDRFDTTYTPLGELLNRLKYRNEVSAASDIIVAAVRFLRPHRDKIDIIVPVPASTVRPVQPVLLLAQGIGTALERPVISCVRKTRAAIPLKGIDDATARQDALNGLYAVDAVATSGRKVLLFDDLYRSGATLNAVTDLLMREGRSEIVRVLTVTRTRSHR